MRGLLEVPVDLDAEDAARERMLAVSPQARRAPACVDLDDPAARVRAVQWTGTEDFAHCSRTMSYSWQNVLADAPRPRDDADPNLAHPHRRNARAGIRGVRTPALSPDAQGATRMCRRVVRARRRELRGDQLLA